MVLTILEAVVEEKNWPVLQEIFESMTQDAPPEIKNSYLVQGQSDKSIWRILTFWESQEALTAMRESGETPVGVVIFKKAEADPTLQIFDIQKSIFD